MQREQAYNIIRESRPLLRFCEQFKETSPLWNFNQHSHPFLEVMYFIEGKGDISISGHELAISLFDTVVYPANWKHQEAPTAERQREVICFWVDLPELVLNAPILLHDHGDLTGSLFRLVYRESKREAPDPQLLEYGVKLLLTQILRDNSEAQMPGLPLSRVVQYINSNYARKITLDELANIEHISKSYLSRQFKRLTGVTIVEYINKYRIEAAKHLLIGTEKAIEEIAELVGFESPKYFFRIFKTHTGESPAGFRRQCRNI